jgi:hypothetical protein
VQFASRVVCPSSVTCIFAVIFTCDRDEHQHAGRLSDRATRALVLMLDGACKPSFQPLSAARWRNAIRFTTMREPPSAAIFAGLLPQVGVPQPAAHIRPLGQKLHIALILTGQLRSLPALRMRATFRSALSRLQRFVALHVITSVELGSEPPTKTDAKQRLANAGGNRSRWEWIGSRYREQDIHDLLTEWGVPYRLALLPATAAGLAHRVSRLMHPFGRSLNASALMAFDPHEANPQLATQWWKLALAFEELQHVEAETNTTFDFVLKVRPDVCPHGLLRVGNLTIATLRRERHIAWLNLDYLALLPRYAAPYYFRWSMLRCINGRFAPPEHGPRANDLQSSMAASGVPVVELSYRNPKAAGPNGTRAHMVALLRGCIVRTVRQRRPPSQPSHGNGQAAWATATAFGKDGGASTCAWVPPELWMGSGAMGCAPMRCQ